MILVREFCYRYAMQNKLFEITSRDSKTIVPHPLGYGTLRH